MYGIYFARDTGFVGTLISRPRNVPRRRRVIARRRLRIVEGHFGFRTTRRRTCLRKLVRYPVVPPADAPIFRCRRTRRYRRPYHSYLYNKCGPVGRARSFPDKIDNGNATTSRRLFRKRGRTFSHDPRRVAEPAVRTNEISAARNIRNTYTRGLYLRRRCNMYTHTQTYVRGFSRSSPNSKRVKYIPRLPPHGPCRSLYTRRPVLPKSASARLIPGRTRIYDPRPYTEPVAVQHRRRLRHFSPPLVHPSSRPYIYPKSPIATNPSTVSVLVAYTLPKLTAAIRARACMYMCFYVRAFERNRRGDFTRTRQNISVEKGF